MSETLKTVLDKYIESQNKVVFRENAVPEDKDGYVDAIKKSLTDKIYDEIRAEVRDEALADASKIIEEKAGLKRIDEFKKLAINGVIVAFFVGLLVNQSTDIIGYWKGSFQASNIWITVGIAVALLVICIIIFAYMFISELIKMLRKDKMRQIEVGKKYKHFKNKEYLILAIATHSETGEKYVVYKALYGKQEIYVRPYNMFISEVDHKKYPDIVQKYRFELIN